MTNEEAIKYLIHPTVSSTGIGKEKQKELDAYNMAIKALEQEIILDKIRAEIMDCLEALDYIEKTGLKLYPPNEMAARRLTYQQCLEFIDKYMTGSEGI